MWLWMLNPHLKKNTREAVTSKLDNEGNRELIKPEHRPLFQNSEEKDADNKFKRMYKMTRRASA